MPVGPLPTSIVSITVLLDICITKIWLSSWEKVSISQKILRKRKTALENEAWCLKLEDNTNCTDRPPQHPPSRCCNIHSSIPLLAPWLHLYQH